MCAKRMRLIAAAPGLIAILSDPSRTQTVTNERTGARLETRTNEMGSYRAPFLPVGVYTVRVEAV